MYNSSMTNVISISDIRANLPSMVDKVYKNLDRFFITVGGKPKAVLVSAEELKSLEETAEILSIPGARKSILSGLKEAKKEKGILLENID